jgi:hypothetical protein
MSKLFIILIILIVLLILSVSCAVLISIYIKKRATYGRFDIIDKAIRLDQYTDANILEIYRNNYEDLSEYSKLELEKEIKRRKLSIDG